MSINTDAYHSIKEKTDAAKALLVAVSKTKPNEDISTLYEMGHRDFGENYVQELLKKQLELPSDIRWHFIGHLQTNKVKQIAPFVHLIHGVDSFRMLDAIEKEGKKLNKKINCLIQVHIAEEETKFGFDITEAREAATHFFIENKYPHVNLCGLMGMASFTENIETIKEEFAILKSLFDEIKAMKDADTNSFNTLSMGMSADYPIALENGSTLVRIGSMLFGARG
jgi:hypothetical protein